MELCSGEGCLIKVLASTQLKLSEISHDDEIGNQFLNLVWY